jgi:hypothetical protein
MSRSPRGGCALTSAIIIVSTFLRQCTFHITSLTKQVCPEEDHTDSSGLVEPPFLCGNEDRLDTVREVEVGKRDGQGGHCEARERREEVCPSLIGGEVPRSREVERREQHEERGREGVGEWQSRELGHGDWGHGGRVGSAWEQGSARWSE